MTKRPNWESLLGRFLIETAQTPWRFGRQGCCTFAAHAVRCQRKRFALDPELEAFVADNAGDDEDRADALLRRWDGVEGIAERMAALNRVGEVRPALAQRGDIVVIAASGGNGVLLGVVDTTGRKIAATDGRGGLQFVPLARGLRAWRI